MLFSIVPLYGQQLQRSLLKQLKDRLRRCNSQTLDTGPKLQGADVSLPGWLLSEVSL